MPYTFQDIQAIAGGTLLNARLFDHPVDQLLYDSRRLSRASQSVFFALKGLRQDGHDYIEELYDRGVRNFVISRKFNPDRFPEANLLLVSDPLQTLQKLAATHRQQFQLPVIGITGSNGKTIIKEWLYQLLHQDYNLLRSPRSYNSQLGVPLSVWLLEPQHDLAIFEAGISTVGEMEKLAPVIDCSIGLLSNIGSAHDQGFESREEKTREKLKLFANAEVLIYRSDNPLIRRLAGELSPDRYFCWSTSDQQADLLIRQIETTPDGQTLIRAEYQESLQSLCIPFKDAASIENAIHCWAVMLWLGYDIEKIRPRMLSLRPLAMRLELKKAINDCLLVNDSYNSDLDSLENALNFVEQHDNKGVRTLILSDILESGKSKETLYGAVSRMAREKKVDRLFGIGPAISKWKALFPASVDVRVFPDSSAFLKALPEIRFNKEIILLKGARRFAFEKIAAQLERKAHATVLEINLSALTHNLQFYSSLLHPQTRLMIMVKASAYGSGGTELARLLEHQPVDYLAVAYADEGIELRQAGISLPILVINPEENSFGTMIRHQLEPEIYSISQVKKLLKSTGKETICKVHIKLDTGMRRLGFEEKDIDLLIGLLSENPRLRVQSVFSHLVASDDPGHDDFTHQQFGTFDRMYQRICTGLRQKPFRHLLNTAGIARFPQYQMEMVRLGIGLYGIQRDETSKGRLQPVHRLRAVISQIKEVKAGESIGYNRSGMARQDLRSATISIGYADGLLRAAGNERYAVKIAGKRAPIIGNVCMDMCMVDITDIPEAKEGDEVLIFGDDLPLEELATCLQTIPYEILTNISTRVRRVYFQE